MAARPGRHRAPALRAHAGRAGRLRGYQCDAVPGFANARLNLLNYHDAQTGRRTENLTSSSTNDRSELAGLPACITAMTPVPATLPPGREHARQANDLRLKTDRRDTRVAHRAG